MLDCLGRTEIEVPAVRPRAERCIATLSSAGFAELLDDMLGSLGANGECEDCLVVVLVVDDDPLSHAVAAAHGALTLRCRRLGPANPTIKAALYSVAHVVDAREFICLDSDMIVLGPLGPVFDALDVAAGSAVLACPEGDLRLSLGGALVEIYGGSPDDVERLVPGTADLLGYPLVVNDGLFAARASSLGALDAAVRLMPAAAEWVDERPDVWWRNQFVFNLALARLRCGALLDHAFNVQLHVEDVRFDRDGERVRAVCANGGRANVVHFNGSSRGRYPDWSGLFARLTGGERLEQDLVTE